MLMLVVGFCISCGGGSGPKSLAQDVSDNKSCSTDSDCGRAQVCEGGKCVSDGRPYPKDVESANPAEFEPVSEELAGELVIESSDSKSKATTLCNGLLELVQGGSTYTKVRGLTAGSFRWVFSRGGRVIAMSAWQYVTKGRLYDARGTAGASVGINCR
mgnify:CR=1 FL=1